MKSVAILAATAACASAASISAVNRRDACQDTVFQSLSNPSTGKCIVWVSYNSNADTYGLSLGDCGSDAKGFLPLTFDHDTNTLHTEDNKYCVGSLGNKSGNGATVGLVNCNWSNGVEKGAQWSSLSSTEQWKNKFSLCMQYDADSDSFIQTTCQSSPIPIGSAQQFVFSGPKIHPPCPQPPPPPPPPAQTQSCGSWAVKFGGSPNACGAGYSYTAGDSDMCAADNSNCQAICCSPNTPPPPPSQQSCGSWAVKYGGSPNCCGPDMIYTAQDGDMCDASGDNCQAQCCSNRLY